jgi:hypothetical protein
MPRRDRAGARSPAQAHERSLSAHFGARSPPRPWRWRSSSSSPPRPGGAQSPAPTWFTQSGRVRRRLPGRAPGNRCLIMLERLWSTAAASAQHAGQDADEYGVEQVVRIAFGRGSGPARFRSGAAPVRVCRHRPKDDHRSVGGAAGTAQRLHRCYSLRHSVITDGKLSHTLDGVPECLVFPGM